MRVPFATMLAVACLTIAGCGGINSPSDNTVDTFSDTLPVGGVSSKQFSASKSGELTVKLTALAPTSNGIVGLIWTQALPDGTCAGILFQVVTQVGGLSAISGQSIISGRYCIVIQDITPFTVPQTYTYTVSHP
jgi:hypothetical protein